MEVIRALRIEALKARIDRSEYHVDAQKVAAAVLGRPSARIWLVPPAVPAVPASRQAHGVATRTPAA